jgi:hypothetical protein
MRFPNQLQQWGDVAKGSEPLLNGWPLMGFERRAERKMKRHILER